MRRRTLLAAVAGGTAALAGCATLDGSPTADRSATRSPAGSSTPSAYPEMLALPAVDAPTRPFVRGNADFGLALQARLASQAPNENRFLSPYGIGVALSMAYLGARGETRTEMAEALRLRPSDEGLHRSVAALRTALPLAGAGGTPTPTRTPPEETSAYGTVGHPFRLLGANAAWAQAGFPFREQFLAALREHYAVGLGTVDFESSPETARRRINRWVAARTRREVPELFPSGTITDLTRLVLANAVYFRANWAQTFDEQQTAPATFTALDGSTTEVPMMEQARHFPYAAVGDHRVVRLPYAGGDAEMLVLLPAEGEFRAFERSLSAARLADLAAATEREKGTLRLPKFGFRSSLSLASHLRGMGVERAFTERADFTGMATGRPGEMLALDDVRHEATVTVDEQGTEAAAATGVEVVLESAPTWEMTLDRPFLFAIRHPPTGAVLFLGRVVDAGAAQPDG